MSEVKRSDCAASAAHFYLAPVVAVMLAFVGSSPSYGAVPVEESVEDRVQDGSAQDNSAQSNRSGTQVRESRRRPVLSIPPTIEPVANTDERPAFGNTQTQVAPLTPNSSGTSDAGAYDTGGETRLRDLFYQLQVLQQEVQSLRGTVEEQDFMIRRLQKDQKDQYLDLDSRVLALQENRPQPFPGSSSQPTQPVVQGGNLSEKDAYRLAFDAMRDSRFEESAAGFRQLIENFPNGQYTPNAFYWMGEIFLVADSDLEQARQSFMQVVNLYPDHQKTPDALYKLGVVSVTLGDLEAANRFLTRVQSEHGGTSAAAFAKKFAQEMR